MPACRRTDSESMEYVVDLLGELRMIPDSSRHSFLVYLLEMAFIEAARRLDECRTSVKLDERDTIT